MVKSIQNVLEHEEIHNIDELSTGLFNNTYKVNTANNLYILKVAPHLQADVFFPERDLMRREQSLATTLRSACKLIPRYCAFFNVGERQAFLQEYVHGKLWYEHHEKFSKKENQRIWYQLGKISKNLHSCTGQEFGYPRPGQRFKKWSLFIQNMVNELAQDAKNKQLDISSLLRFSGMLVSFSDRLDKNHQAKLCHGDLWSRNIIVDGEGDNIHIKALIDCERAYWGDPLSEWVFVLSEIPDAFWQGYGQNLLKQADPVCVAIYQGMYFMLNILEDVRIAASPTTAQNHLDKVIEYLSTQA